VSREGLQHNRFGPATAVELEPEHIAGRTAAETPDNVWSIDTEVLAEPRQTITTRARPQLRRHDVVRHRPEPRTIAARLPINSYSSLSLASRFDQVVAVEPADAMRRVLSTQCPQADARPQART
jgi:hypothetical protein